MTSVVQGWPSCRANWIVAIATANLLGDSCDWIATSVPFGTVGNNVKPSPELSFWPPGWCCTPSSFIAHALLFLRHSCNTLLTITLQLSSFTHFFCSLIVATSTCSLWAFALPSLVRVRPLPWLFSINFQTSRHMVDLSKMNSNLKAFTTCCDNPDTL